jgi:hypothetical protein
LKPERAGAPRDRLRGFDRYCQALGCGCPGNLPFTRIQGAGWPRGRYHYALALAGYLLRSPPGASREGREATQSRLGREGLAAGSAHVFARDAGELAGAAFFGRLALERALATQRSLHLDGGAGGKLRNPRSAGGLGLPHRVHLAARPVPHVEQQATAAQKATATTINTTQATTCLVLPPSSRFPTGSSLSARFIMVDP